MTGTRILIVEDEAIIAMDLQSKLKALGYIVTSIVDNGEAALKKAEADQPDLILMDIRIKGAMDGIETAALIRERSGIPVVFTTAYLEEERIDRAKITMPFGYLLKPYRERDLKVTLEMALYVAKADAERRRIEKELAESEKRYRGILENMEEGYAEYDLSGKLVFFNDAFCNIHGYSKESLRGFNFKDLNGPELSQELLQFGKRVYKTGETMKLIEQVFTRQSGELIHLESSVSLMKSDGESPVGFRMVVRDVTDKIKAEEALRISEEKNRLILEHAQNEIAIIDENGIILLLNHRSAARLGGVPDDFIGKSYWDVYPKAFADKRQKEREEIIKSGIAVTQEIEFPFEQGLRWLSVTAVPCKIENSSAILSIHEDITERKQRELESV
jgi:PAS domain S-box-containing protein